MTIGLIGDLHADVYPKNIIAVMDYMEQLDVDFCLQVGDYLAYNIHWERPLFWITGNHEDGPVLKEYINGSYKEPPNNHWLMGGLVNIAGINVMALPGLPNSRQKPGPARYPENVYNLCMEQSDEPVDIFISHGCGYPFWVWTYDKKISKSKMVNREEDDITSLIKKVKPKIAVSGHNHRFDHIVEDGIEFVRLGFKPQEMFYTIEI